MNDLFTLEFLSAREESRFYDFGTVDLPTVTWQDIITEFNTNVVNNQPFQLMENFGFILYTGRNIPQINKVCEYISQLDTSVETTAHIYASMCERSHTFGIHQDTSGVFFWQAHGQTKWTVHDKLGVLEFVTEPGHLVYIPKNMYHGTHPLTPRIGISIGLEY